MSLACRGGATDIGSHPRVRGGIISSARLQPMIGPVVVIATPYGHLATSPHCRMKLTRRRCVRYASGRPRVGVGIVSAAVFN
jgi:hypothetical protein